jgi:hypothetical protein
MTVYGMLASRPSIVDLGVHIKTPDSSVSDLLSHLSYLLLQEASGKYDECFSFSKNRLSTVLCLALSLGDICMIPKVTPQSL